MKIKTNIKELANILEEGKELDSKDYQICFNRRRTECIGDCSSCNSLSRDKRQWLNGMTEALINKKYSTFIHHLKLLGCRNADRKDSEKECGCSICPLQNKETGCCNIQEEYFNKSIKFLLDYGKRLTKN